MAIASTDNLYISIVMHKQVLPNCYHTACAPQEAIRSASGSNTVKYWLKSDIELIFQFKVNKNWPQLLRLTFS